MVKWEREGFASSADRRRAVQLQQYYAKKALQQAASAVQPPLHLPVPPVMMAMPSTEEMEDIWHLATGTPPPSAPTPPSFYVPPTSISVPLYAAAHFPFITPTIQVPPLPASIPLPYHPYFASTPPSFCLPSAYPSAPLHTDVHLPFIPPFQPPPPAASLLPPAWHPFYASSMPPSVYLPWTSPSFPCVPPVQPPPVQPPSPALQLPIANHPHFEESFEENAEGCDVEMVSNGDGDDDDDDGDGDDDEDDGDNAGAALGGGAIPPADGDNAGAALGGGAIPPAVAGTHGAIPPGGHAHPPCGHACCVSACDALNCEACVDCGQPRPPANVAETVARMRMQLHVADHEDDALPRPHGGPALRQFVSPSMLSEFERVNGALDIIVENPDAAGAQLGNGQVLVWAHVAGFPRWPALAPATWRTATAQVTVIFLGMQGQTGKASVTQIHPLQCTAELQAKTVSTKWRDLFERAQIEAVELLAAAGVPQVRERAPKQQAFQRQALRQHASKDTKPVVIQCTGCSRRYFFDFIWDLCYRMQLHADWYKRYLDSPARHEILGQVERTLHELLAKTRVGDELVLQWSCCFTCEFQVAVRTRAAVELMELRAVTNRLEALPAQAVQTAVEFGVIRAPRKKLQLSRGHADAPRNAAFHGLSLVVTIWPSTLKPQLSECDLRALHSAPYGTHATSTELHGLNYERARARGCEFDGALYLLAEPEAYQNLRALQSANDEDDKERLAALSSACLSGNVQFLAATHFGGLDDAGAAAVDAAALHKEEEAVLSGASAGNAGDGCSSNDEKDQASMVGNRSAAGRSGRWWCYSGLVRNPTAQMAVSASRLHADHFLVVAPTDGKLDAALLCYTSRAGARALKERDGNDTTFHLRGDDQPSLPRMFQEMPGRKYHHFSHVQNMELQAKSGSASTKRAVAVATSRVRLLLFLAHIGLVPPPPPPHSAETLHAEPGTSREHRLERRTRERDDSAGACWPLIGAAQTARITWEAFEQSSTREGALRCLACLKGYYLNFFPSPVHLDSDNNLESWTLREIEQLQQQLSGASSANAGATVLPLRGLALFTRPERDVTHAFFKNEEHGAWDSGMVSEGRGGVDGWATGFHLQSGGASRRRLRTVLDWYRNL